MYVITALCFKS